MKTYHLVLAPTVPGLSSDHKYTRDVSTLANAPVSAVILVIDMPDEAFNALNPAELFG